MKCFVRAFAVICIVAVIGAFYYARCNNSGATDVITPLKMNLCEEVPRFIDAQKYENQYIYNYKKDGLDIYLCCNDAEAYNYETAASWVHLWINGSEYVLNSLDKPAFMHGSSTSPELVIEDFNDDGIDDIMVFIESERLGILQQALISKSDTSYDNIGTISWAQDMDGSFGGQGLTYNISYNLDEEKAWLDVSDYTDVSNELRPDTEVLDTVRKWGASDKQLYEKNMSFIRLDNGKSGIRCEYHIGCGYSDICIGYYFYVEWQIDAAGYSINDIKLVKDSV